MSAPALWGPLERFPAKLSPKAELARVAEFALEALQAEPELGVRLAFATRAVLLVP